MENQITSFLYCLNDLPTNFVTYQDSFIFETLNKSNSEKFIQTYLETHKNSASEVFITNNPYQYASDAIFDDDWLIPSLCKLVYENDNLAGIILGGKEKDQERFGAIGILEFIGVVPQYRNKGIGQKLFYCALLDLKNYGFNYYCDGTLDSNIPMLKLFENLQKHLSLLIKGRNWEIDSYLEKNPLQKIFPLINYPIRSIQIQDIPLMLDFLNQCELENNGHRTLVDIYEKTPEGLSKQIHAIHESQNDFLLVAATPDKIIGVLDFYDSTNDDDPILLAELGITVLKEYQNQGIGTKLMLNAINKAKHDTNMEQILLSVDSKNCTAIHIYENLGFKTSQPFIKGSKTTLEMILEL